MGKKFFIATSTTITTAISHLASYPDTPRGNEPQYEAISGLPVMCFSLGRGMPFRCLSLSSADKGEGILLLGGELMGERERRLRGDLERLLGDHRSLQRW